MVVLTILIFRRTTIRTKAITSIFILSLALYLKFLILKCVAAIVLHTSSLVLLRRSAKICTPSWIELVRLVVAFSHKLRLADERYSILLLR